MSKDSDQKKSDQQCELLASKPATFGDCLSEGWGEHDPCPFVSCRHHLIWAKSTHVPGSPESMEDIENVDVYELEGTCALRMSREEMTLEEVGKFFEVTRERIRQIESKGKRRAKLLASKLRDGFLLIEGREVSRPDLNVEERQHEKIAFGPLVKKAYFKLFPTVANAGMNQLPERRPSSLLKDRGRVLQGEEKQRRIAELMELKSKRKSLPVIEATIQSEPSPVKEETPARVDAEPAASPSAVMPFAASSSPDTEGSAIAELSAEKMAIIEPLLLPRRTEAEVEEAAVIAGVSKRSVYRWMGQYEQGGETALSGAQTKLSAAEKVAIILPLMQPRRSDVAVEKTAEAAGVSKRSIYRWLSLYAQGGEEALVVDDSNRGAPGVSRLGKSRAYLLEASLKRLLDADPDISQRKAYASVAKIFERAGMKAPSMGIVRVSLNSMKKDHGTAEIIKKEMPPVTEKTKKNNSAPAEDMRMSDLPHLIAIATRAGGIAELERAMGVIERLGGVDIASRLASIVEEIKKS